jgi:hypothetical protein
MFAQVPHPEQTRVSLDTIIFRLRVLPPSTLLMGAGEGEGGGVAGEAGTRREDRNEGVSGWGERGGREEGELGGGHDLKSPLKRELENMAKYAPASHCAGYVAPEGELCTVKGFHTATAPSPPSPPPPSSTPSLTSTPPHFPQSHVPNSAAKHDLGLFEGGGGGKEGGGAGIKCGDKVCSIKALSHFLAVSRLQPKDLSAYTCTAWQKSSSSSSSSSSSERRPSDNLLEAKNTKMNLNAENNSFQGDHALEDEEGDTRWDAGAEGEGVQGEGGREGGGGGAGLRATLCWERDRVGGGCGGEGEGEGEGEGGKEKSRWCPCGSESSEEADFDIRSSVSYQPDPEVLRNKQKAAACEKTDADTLELLDRLSSLLNAKDCGRAVAVPVVGYGFAASFHYAVLQLGRALKYQLAVSFSGYFLYAPPSCKDSSMECVFKPASLTCGHLAFSEGTHTAHTDRDASLYLAEAWFAEVQHTSSLDRGRQAIEDGLYACCAARHHAAVDCVRRVDLYAAQVHERCGERNPRWVPSEFAARKGSFWFRSVLAGYLFAPLPSYLEHFQPLERRLNAGQGGVLGVHIRRGDACHIPQGIDHNQHCVATERYLEAIRNLLSRYSHLKRVFVASNAGPGLLEDIRAGLPGVEVLVQDIQDRAKYACCAKVFFSLLEWRYWNRAYKTVQHTRAVQRF